MADLPVTPLANYGELLSSLPLAASTVATQSAQQSNLRATAGMTQAQTIGEGLKNQLLQSQLDYRQNLPGALSAASQSSMAAPPESGSLADGGLHPDQIQAHANAKFYVSPAWTPQEMAAMSTAVLSGQQGAPETVSQMHDRRVQNQQTQAVKSASDTYDSAFQVATSPPGAALQALNRGGPEAQAKAAQIEATAKSKGWSPEEIDRHVRELATEIGGSSYAFSKYAADAKRDTDGILKDSRGRPVLESTQAGLSAPQQSERQIKLAEPVTYGDQLPKPLGQAGGLAGSQPQNAPAQRPALPAGALTPVRDPVLKAALADSNYDLKPLPTPKTQEDLKSNNDLRAASNAARTELLSDAKDATNSGSQSLQYLNAAKAIMESKGAPITGPLGGLVAKLTGAFGSVDATNYQEAAKYLGNAAIQAGKGNFGKGMTQNDVQLQKDELSPSVHMTDAALKDLIGSGIKNTQYTLDSSKRVGEYLTRGKDPQRFAEWNDTHFNRSDTVNKQEAKTPAQNAATDGATSVSKSGKPIVFTNGHWQYK